MHQVGYGVSSTIASMFEHCRRRAQYNCLDGCSLSLIARNRVAGVSGATCFYIINEKHISVSLKIVNLKLIVLQTIIPESVFAGTFSI